MKLLTSNGNLIEDPEAITKILAHLDLPTKAPPRHLRYAPALRNPASLAYQPKPSLAWAFAAHSQLTPATLEDQGRPPAYPLLAP